jgi:hypothetical protein
MPIIAPMNTHQAPFEDVSAVERLLRDAESRRDRARPGSREYHAAAREVAARWHMLRVARARRRSGRQAERSRAAA